MMRSAGSAVRDSGGTTFNTHTLPSIPEIMSDTIVYVDDSSIHGKGLFAKTFIPSGTVIGVVQGEPTTTDGEHVLWIDESEGFHVQCDLRYINHSDTPNATFYDNLDVCATRDIKAGEEITHNYGAGWEDWTAT